MFKNKKLASALLLTTFVVTSVATTALAAGSNSLRRFLAMTEAVKPSRFRIRIGTKPRIPRNAKQGRPQGRPCFFVVH
jgi:hypothetical protein